MRQNDNKLYMMKNKNKNYSAINHSAQNIQCNVIRVRKNYIFN